MADTLANNAAAEPLLTAEITDERAANKKMKIDHPALETSNTTGFGQLSELQKDHLRHKVDIPDILKVPHRLVDAGERDMNNMGDILALFPSLSKGSLKLCHLSAADGLEKTEGPPMNVGIVLSGGQAAGGNNVIIGLFRSPKYRHPGSTPHQALFC